MESVEAIAAVLSDMCCPTRDVLPTGLMYGSCLEVRIFEVAKARRRMELPRCREKDCVLCAVCCVEERRLRSRKRIGYLVIVNA